MNIRIVIMEVNILYIFFSCPVKGLFSVSRGDINNIRTTQSNSNIMNIKINKVLILLSHLTKHNIIMFEAKENR